jgi:hypothetical protein
MSLQRIGNRLVVACQGCNVFTNLIQRYRNRWHDAIAEVWLTTIRTHLPPHGSRSSFALPGRWRK